MTVQYREVTLPGYEDDQAEGRKHDQGKARWTELVPWAAVRRVCRAQQPRVSTTELLAAYALSDITAAPLIARRLLGDDPMQVLATAVDVLEFGARKYAPDNWQKVPDARQRYFDAMCRHLSASGLDPETRLPHEAHALCCALFLIWFDIQEEQDNEKPISASSR